MTGLQRNSTAVTPLILSFSPWEKGRLNGAWSVQHRPLSHGERDRVRGGRPGEGS